MGEVVEGGGEKGRKIVVAVDESEESMYALSWCISNVVLRNPNSEDALVILHAKRPTVVYPGFQNSADVLSHDVLASLDRRDRDMARWVIQKALKVCKDHDVKLVEERVEDGNPGDVICDMVKVLGADLLVMGSHGYGLITRALLESVSSYCVQNASCPVLVVKMPKSTSSATATK